MRARERAHGPLLVVGALLVSIVSGPALAQTHPWHLPTKHLRKKREPATAEEDWNPLGAPMRSLEDEAKGIGIRYDLDLAPHGRSAVRTGDAANRNQPI